MALTASKMNQLSSKLQKFSLPDVTNDGARYSVTLERDKPLLVVFICNHCPYVVHIIDALVAIVKTHQKQIETVFISSNDVDAYPDDSPSNMKKFAKEHKFTAPYLYDESQSVAKSFSAKYHATSFLAKDKTYKRSLIRVVINQLHLIFHLKYAKADRNSV